MFRYRKAVIRCHTFTKANTAMEDEKKYQPPRLTVHGDLRTLTRGTQTTGMTDSNQKVGKVGDPCCS